MKLWLKLKHAYAERIQFRLTFNFMLILIPLVVVSLFANVRSTDILAEQSGERTRITLQSVMDHIDLTLQDLENLSTLIATDYSIVPVLHEANEILLTSDIYNFYTVMDRLTSMTEANSNIKEISVLHTASRYLLSTVYGGRRLDNEQVKWFEEALRTRGASFIYVPERDASSIFDIDSFVYMHMIDSQQDQTSQNILMLSIPRSKFFNLINSAKLTENTSLYLYMTDGQLLIGTDRQYNEDRWQNLQAGQTGNTENGMLVWRITSEQSGWSLVMIQPKEELYKESTRLSYFTVLIILISIALALLISLEVYKGISEPLMHLLHGMKQVRLGKLDMRLSSGRRDEFGALNEAFNQMIADQQRLIRDVYEHQLQLSKTELKFLHSQINPHFLYNTLDSIYWTAKNYDAEELSEMVLNLSRFFRLSLGKGKDTFTVEETMEHLMYYLKVQQFRFMDQFTVSFHLDTETKHIPVLKLLLQPVVENAILHGLEKRGPGGKLVISSKMESDMLCIVVEDNGAGISEERLSFIRRQIQRIEQMDLQSYPVQHHEQDSSVEMFGLRNVLVRMKLYYGQKAKLEVQSEEGSGTTVMLWIPYDGESQ